MALSQLRWGRLLALASPVFWSTTGVAVRLLEDADEWQTNFYRSASLALFVLLVLVVRNRCGTWQVVCRAGPTAILAGALVGASMFCNIVALTYTSVANATMLMASGPLVAVLLGRAFLSEPISRTTWIAIVLVGIGIAIMVGGGIRGGSFVGDAIALVGVAFFGSYAVVLRRGADVDMTPAVFYAGAFSATAAAVVACTVGRGLVTTLHDTAICVGLGVFQLGIGSVLFAMASRSVPAAELTLFALGEPVLAPLWAWLVVAEVPATETFVGGALMVLALVMLARSSRGAS